MSRLRPEIFVYECRQRWLRRTLRLTGAVDALIHYDGRALGIGSSPDERVYVDQVLVQLWRPEHTSPKRAIPFRVHALAAEIEVALSWIGLHQITYFKLTVDGEVFYEEARDRVLLIRNPPPVPIPSQAPAPDPELLPIPADAEPPPL